MIQNKFFRTLEWHRLLAAILLFALFALEGCVKRTEFEQASVSEGGIEIALEWEQTATPTPLTFAFYRVGDDTLLYKEFEGTVEGFNGTLPEGEYKMIAYDKSAQRVSYRNMDSYLRAEVYAQDAAKTVKAGDGTLITEPGAVYAVGECVGMATLTVTAGKTLVTKAQPQNRTRSAVLKFEIKNGVTITSITGAMEGVSSSVLLCTGKSSSYSARLPFLVNRAVDNSFHISVSLFDFITAEVGDSEVNTMDVTLGEASGATHDIKLDITDTIRDIIHDNGGVIPIVIPIEVEVDMTDIEHITAIVKPWESGGDGGGEVVG